MSKKIQKGSVSATSLLTINEMFRPSLMSKSSVFTIVESDQKYLKQL